MRDTLFLAIIVTIFRLPWHGGCYLIFIRGVENHDFRPHRKIITIEIK